MSRRIVIVVLVGIALVNGCGTSAPAQTPLATTAATAQSSAVATARPTPRPTPVPTLEAAGYADLPGWIVFEHFGAKPDGSSTELDFDNRMIWLVRADGSDLQELSPSGPAGGKSSPDISPDGTTVAFNTWAHPQIWTAPIDGGPPTRISTDCDGVESRCVEGEPSYSGDGKKLAFVREAVADGVKTTAIGVRDLDSGEVEMLDSTSTELDEGYVTQPAFAPDASAIVYYRVAQTPTQERPTGSRLFVVNADGTNLRELPVPDNGWAADPDWSPDGSLIVFSSAPNRETEGWGSDEGAPEGRIYTVNPDGSGMSEVCGGCPNVGLAPSFTSDGRIFFWGLLTFALMDADGANAAHINAPELTWFGDKLGYGYAGWLAPSE